MYRQSRSLAALLLAAFVAVACGDSDPIGPSGGSGSDEAVLTGTWYLAESANVKFPIRLQLGSDECDAAAREQGYDYGHTEAAISEYWLTFKSNGTVTHGLVGRSRCSFHKDTDAAYSDWGDEVRGEENLGSYRRSGNDLELFSVGYDPDTGLPEFTGKITDKQITLAATMGYFFFPSGVEVVFKRR